MTNRQAITAVATLGVCICQQVRKLQIGSKQEIYSELKEVEDAILRLGKKAGSHFRGDQAEMVADRFTAFTKSLAEVK